MNRVYTKFVFLFLLFTLMSSNLTSVTGREGSLGVNDGDTFDFIIEKHSTNIPSNLGYFLGHDTDTYEAYYAQGGDEFTVKVVNATPILDSYGYWFLGLEISSGNKTFPYAEDIDVGNYVTWNDGWDDLSVDIEKVEAEYNADPDSIAIFTSIDTKTEAGFKGSVTRRSEDDTTNIIIEIRFDRSTGVLLYQFSKIEIVGSNDYFGELIVKRKGYSLPTENDAGSLPGFEFVPIIAAFTIMFILIIINRRN